MPLLGEHALASLRSGFREVFRQWNRGETEGDALLERLLRPARVLEQLHGLSRRTLEGDAEATAELRSAVRDLVTRFPGYRGSVDTLRSRVGLTPNPEPIGGIPCALIEPIGIVPIYLGVATAFGVGSEELPGALDVVAGIGLDHGHLEVTNGALSHGGVDALARSLAWTESTRSRPLPAGRDGGLIGYTPDPDDQPPVPPDDPFGGLPGKPDPPRPDFCELLREGCEAMLADALTRDIGSPPPRPDHIAWADNIDQIEMPGHCAGDTIVIHGSGFGDPQPPGIELVMRVDGHCVAVPVNIWTDTRIEVTLPVGINSGAVGFVDQGYLNAYNAWVARWNRKWRDIANASRCLKIGAPNVPGLPKIGTPCPPPTPVNVIQAGLPLLQSFTVNFGAVAVVEPDDDIILRWYVLNADDITLRRVSAAGPDFGGNNSVQNPSGTSWNLGAANHASPMQFRYRLIATNPCGSVQADVRVNASKRPRLAIDRIEVTQGIQNSSNTVRLVKNKPTVVRVYASHGLAGFWNDVVPGVTGRLRTRRKGRAWSSWLDPINSSATAPPTPTPGASIRVPSTVDRTQTNDTLNFLLPTSRAEGEIDIQVELRVTGFGAVGGLPGFDGDVTRTFESQPIPFFVPNHFGFYKRKRLTIRYVRVRWSGTTPTHQQCRNTLRLSIQRIPTPGATISALSGVGVQSRPTPNNFDDVSDLVDEFDDRHNCSFWEGLTSWLGSDCPEDDDSYWALVSGGSSGGKAAGIPSNTYLTPRNDMNRAPHELGHCLDQRHIEVACPNGRQAGGGDDADDWPDQGQLQNVPFDIENNTTVVATNNVWDIMTYCGTRWTMPRRWNRIYDHIGS